MSARVDVDEDRDAPTRRAAVPLRTVLLFAAGLLSLWLLRSSLGDVYGELGSIAQVDPRWLVAILLAEAVTFVATWTLNRIALRTRRWFDVAVAQLAGNAVNNLVPAGGAAGAAAQLRVLSEAGFDMTTAATSLGALSILGAIGMLTLPVIALPFAIYGGGDHGLQPLLWLGFALLLLMLLVGVELLQRDAPLEKVAEAVQWVLNRVVPSRRARTDLPERVLRERDSIKAALGHRPVMVGFATIAKPGGDCLALYLSLVAVGAHPNPFTVLAAFAAANVAGMVPLTPGGLGFVEAGITTTLVATGIDTPHAILAAALYRVASTWLPVALGAVAYATFRWRHRVRDGGSLSDAREVRARWRRYAVPLVTVVALVVVSPILVRIYRRAPDVFSLGPGWLVAIGVCIVVHFVTAWALYRVVLRTTGWFDIGTSQLASNAASHVLPVGTALGAGMQLRMLTIAGFPASRAATALGATTVMGTVVGYVALPLVVLVGGALGSTVQPRLLGAMWVGAGVLTLLLIGALLLAFRDGPWRRIARGVTAVRRKLHRPGDADELAARLLSERDLMRDAIRERLGLVLFLVLAQPLADFAALYLALRAIGAHVSPAAVLAAFIVSNVAGLVPFTPGGLGFVEAGLAGVLVVAGASRPDARLAVVTYRLAATWIPSIAGAIALGLFHRRHRGRRVLVAEPAPA